MTDVETGTLLVYSDIGCPWSHLAVHRFTAARRRLGLEGKVVLDHRTYPLELVNRRPTPRLVLQAEVPVVGACEPAAGWRVWQAAESEWPVTTLPALEAVQAAREQSLAAAEELDLALRRAFFEGSRCISMLHVILEVAEGCRRVDGAALAAALDSGAARHRLAEQLAESRELGIPGSPTFVLADGSTVFNPGMSSHWEGEEGEGFPVVDGDEPSAHEELLRRALDPSGATTAG